MKRILIEKKNGMFNLQNIYIQLRAAQDGVYEFMMKRVRKKRTINQNDWLWGAVYPLLLDAMLDAGWEMTSVEQVHEFFKSSMPQDDVLNRETGEIVSIPKSTAAMDTVQFSTYIEKLRDYAMEYLNVEIPEPDKDWKKHLNDNDHETSSE